MIVCILKSFVSASGVVSPSMKVAGSEDTWLKERDFYE